MSTPTDSSTLRMASPAARKAPQVLDEIAIRTRLMDRLIDLLIQKCVAKEYWPEAYQRAFDILESLPLPTSEYSLAARRYENARQYAACGEFGAAAFELRQLRGALP